MVRNVGDRLPPRVHRSIVHFYIQTRLVFSRTVLVLLAVLFGVFAFAVNNMGNSSPSEVWSFLTMTAIVLAAVLHMWVFQNERRQQTLEILRSQSGSPNALLRLKLVPGVFWLVALLAPLHAGFCWFLSISPGAALVQFLFLAASCMVAALATCVAATFLRNGIGAGVAAAVVLIPLASGMNRPGGVVRAAVAPFLCTIGESTAWAKLSISGRVVLAVFNLAVVALYATGLYVWLRNRLERTERWFL